MSKKTDLTKFNAEVRPLVRGDILHAPVDGLPVEAAVEAFAIVKHVGKKLEERQKELRAHLIDNKEVLKTAVPVGEGGSTKTMVSGNNVTRKRTEKKLANVKKLREILQAKSIPESEVFTTTTETITTTVVDPSKLDALVQTGRLTEDDMKACHVIQWALTVQASAKVKDLLEEFDRRNLEVRKAIQEAAESEQEF